MALHCTVYLTCQGGERYRTKTRDISPEGFYCVLDQLIQPGERLECDIALPAPGLKSHNDGIHLRCHARAVRLERMSADMEFGLACRIEDYRVIHVPGEGSQLPRRSNR